MSKIVLLISFLFTVNSFAMVPAWLELNPDAHIDSITCQGLPYDPAELVKQHLNPITTEGLIGYKVEITPGPFFLLKTGMFDLRVDQFIKDKHFKTEDGVDLTMNKIPYMNLDTPVMYVREYGDTTHPTAMIVDLKVPIMCGQLPPYQTNILTSFVDVKVSTYNNNYQTGIASGEVKTRNSSFFNKGEIKFTRLHGGDDPELISVASVEEGRLKEGNGENGDTDINAGHYKIEVTRPKRCAMVLNENFVVTPEFINSGEGFNLEVNCPKAYDIFVTYKSPGFNKLETVWRNIFLAKVPEPSDDDLDNDRLPVQLSTFEDVDEDGFVLDVDGKILRVPFAYAHSAEELFTYGTSWKGLDLVSVPEVISTDIGKDKWRVGTRNIDDEMAHYINFEYATEATSDLEKGYNISMNIALDLYDKGDRWHEPRWIKMFPSLSIVNCEGGLPSSPLEFCNDVDANIDMLDDLESTREYILEYMNVYGSVLQLKFVHLEEEDIIEAF